MSYFTEAQCKTGQPDFKYGGQADHYLVETKEEMEVQVGGRYMDTIVVTNKTFCVQTWVE